MEEKKYTKARILLKTLPNEELNSFEVLFYKDTLNFIEIDSVISFNSLRNAYFSIDSILSTSINSITNLIHLKDSLLLKEFYSFNGAQFYNSIGSNSKAYKCLQKYLAKQYFTKEQSQIINQVLKDKINGFWKGENVSSKKILLSAQLYAMTLRSFEGDLTLIGQHLRGYPRLIIENGIFDGYEFSAQAFVLKSDGRRLLFSF